MLVNTTKRPDFEISGFEPSPCGAQLGGGVVGTDERSSHAQPVVARARTASPANERSAERFRSLGASDLILNISEVWSLTRESSWI